MLPSSTSAADVCVAGMFVALAAYFGYKDDQIDGVVPGWRAMSSYGEGVTLRHTARALVAMLDLSEYQTASARDQQLMEWMVLVHDIAKEPRPGIRDHRHAFRSAAQAGIVLPRVGFQVTDAYAAEFDAWKTPPPGPPCPPPSGRRRSCSKRSRQFSSNFRPTPCL